MLAYCFGIKPDAEVAKEKAAAAKKATEMTVADAFGVGGAGADGEFLKMPGGGEGNQSGFSPAINANAE